MISTARDSADRSDFDFDKVKEFFPVDPQEHFHPFDLDHRFDRVSWVKFDRKSSVEHNNLTFEYSKREKKLHFEMKNIDKTNDLNSNRFEMNIRFRFSIDESIRLMM